MLPDILLGCLKQVSHKLLGQPYCFVFKAHIDLDLTVFSFINEELAFTGNGACNGYQIFAHC